MFVFKERRMKITCSSFVLCTLYSFWINFNSAGINYHGRCYNNFIVSPLLIASLLFHKISVILFLHSYFDCRPLYGLFAPVHKVMKTSATSTPSPMTRSMGSTGLRTSRERSGSQESVSSISSATSSASRPRVRLGVSGLGSNQVHAELLMPLL